MALEKPVYQMQLALEGIDEAVENDLHLSVEEINARSERSLVDLRSLRVQDPVTGDQHPPRWMGLFQELLEGGWPWRVAVYIAWSAQAKGNRWPETQDELAIKCLGLTSDRVFSTWRKRNPHIIEVIGMLQAAVVFDALPGTYDAMIKVAHTADYKGVRDRELHYKIAGILSDKLEVTHPGGQNLDQLAFNEVLRLAGINNPEELMALRERLKANLEASAEPEETPGEENDEGDPGE